MCVKFLLFLSNLYNYSTGFQRNLFQVRSFTSSFINIYHTEQCQLFFIFMNKSQFYLIYQFYQFFLALALMSFWSRLSTTQVGAE